jgi:hypothetical protein
LTWRHVELAESRDDILVEPGRFTQFETTNLLAIIVDRAGIRFGELNGVIDNGLE